MKQENNMEVLKDKLQKIQKIENLTFEDEERILELIDEILEKYKPQKKYYEEKLHYTYEDILAIIAQFPADKKWTSSDLQDENIFPPDLKIKIEILDNQLYIMANPRLSHQKILNRTSAHITFFADENNLGEIYVAPSSVRIDENTILEPDIIFIALHKLEKLVTNDKVIEGKPDLVVEVISPSNYKKLREEKKGKYANFGIEEYWEIYPKKQKVIIETLAENEDTQEIAYQVYSEATETGKVQSKVLEGFELNIEKIFK